MRGEERTLKIPPILQQGNSDCGKACVSMVLNYYDVRVRGVESLANNLDGVQVRTIESFFRERGMMVVSGNFNISHLKHFVDVKVPVICLLNDHYVLVKSYFDYRVIYNCPIEGEKKVTARQFLKQWRTVIDGDVLYCWGIAAYKPK